MFNRILITAGLVLAMGAGTAFAPKAQAQNANIPPDNRWFISGMASYPISTGPNHFNGWGGFLGIAKPFNKFFGLELNYQEYYVAPYGHHTNVKNLGLDGMLFLTRGTWNPYLELGLGVMRASYDAYGSNSGGTNNLAFGTIGAGVIWRVASYFDLRADLRFNGSSNFDPSGQGIDNFVASVGFAIPLGSPPHAAPPPAPPPPADSDHDGVPNNLDQCPGTPAGVQVDAHGCPLDSDHDGVPNYLDQCPNTPPGTKVDVHGCPISATIKLPNTHFAFNSSKLTAEDQQSLDDAAATLNKYPNVHAQVAGYTDSIGSKAYNLKLSDRRAASVKQYLVAHGVATSRLTTHGYGEADPVAPNRIDGHDNPAGRAKNRRVELHVMKNSMNNGSMNNTTEAPAMGTSPSPSY